MKLCSKTNVDKTTITFSNDECIGNDTYNSWLSKLSNEPYKKIWLERDNGEIEIIKEKES